MAIDYDEPRGSGPDPVPEPLEELAGVPAAARTADMDLGEADAADVIELPGADLSKLELTVEIVPPKKDEFICSSCYLVHHRSQLARERDGKAVCTECEG